MPKFAYVRVDGAKRLRGKLKEIGDDFEELKAVHREIADRAAEKVRRAIPLGATGRLRGSVRGSGTKTSAAVRLGRKNVPYFGVVEFGGYPEGRPYVAEGRYMYPAIKQFAPTAVEIYEREIDAICARFR